MADSNLPYEILTIVGPTASGKTNLAVKLAERLDTHIISADSRQVYRGMDIGTGKDISAYQLGNKTIPYHLIDICEAGEKYNLFEYQQDFAQAYREIQQLGKLPILCGGTGLYVEAVLKAYQLIEVPENKELRASLADKSLSELKIILESYIKLHNTTDTDSVKRAIRAIEIAAYSQGQVTDYKNFPPLNSLIIALNIERDIRRQKISERLKTRFETGMIDEVKQLIESGVSHESLIYYGLEYKYITQYILGQLTYNEMFTQLETAIHQFSKRQMTWFRGMERRGFKLHWIEATDTNESKIEQILQILYA